MTYFEFFGLPVAFHLDEAALRKAYISNSKKYHPDFYTLATPEEQAAMLEKSSFNNEAWKTLSDADKRMEYILTIKGLLPVSDAQNPLPPDFLLDMMDINERLMELETHFNPALYEQLQQEVQTHQQQILVEVQPILETWSETMGTLQDLEVVKLFFLKKKYLLRVEENLYKFAPTSDP